MELFLLYSLLVGVFFIILFCLLQRQTHHHRLPPGNTGWPLIGETPEFLFAGWNGQLERFVLDRMSRISSSCFKTNLFMENTVVMCGPQGNKFIFSNENKLVTIWHPTSAAKILYSSSDKMIRSRIAQFFKPEPLHKYVGVMDSVAIRHIADFWENKDEIVVLPLAKKYPFLVACKLLLSIEDPTYFAKIFNDMASGLLSVPINLPGTRLNRGIKSAGLFRKEVKEMIRRRKIDLAEKKATPTQDMLSMWLAKQFEGDRSEDQDEDEIVERILALLIGSHDTVSSAITFILKYLAELPHVYDKVCKEQVEIAESKGEGELLTWADIKRMKYTWNVACEVMRLVPPVVGAFRKPLQDFTFAGFHIPKGFKLHWATSSTHYNPEYFPDPEKFDPSRFEGDGPAPYTYIPFGGGPRMCPGMEFARLEILVFIHNIVKRFKWEKLVVDEKTIAIPFPIPAKGLPIRILPLKR